MSIFKKLILVIALFGIALAHMPSAFARGYYYQPRARAYNPYPPAPYYGNSYYPSYPGYTNPAEVIIVAPPQNAWPRQGANDYLYQYDNIYGPEASSAGRMGHHIVNPRPQPYFY